MKESNEHTLKDAIEKLIKTYRLESGMNENKIINSWEKITGKIIAKHTEKIYFKEKKLFLKLDSPALKNELSFAREKLITLINKEVGQDVVNEIVLL